MSTQYDAIGTSYNQLKLVSAQMIHHNMLRSLVGDVSGFRVLELACGTGFYTTQLVDWGAAHVTAVDISSAMIDSAKQALPPAMQGKIEYFVGNCADANMLAELGKEEGSFDIVVAAWLLHYAASPAEMGRMFANVHAALKPGGRFVSLTVNPFLIDHFDATGKLGEEYLGSTYHKTGTNEYGLNMRVIGHVTPKVEFDCYFMPPKVFTEAAKLGGFDDLTWHTVMPDDAALKKYGEEYWKPYYKEPKNSICVTMKK